MTERILIVGAGGHAQVVADILLAAAAAGAAVTPLGYVDDNPATHGKSLLDLPVFGGSPEIAHIRHDSLILAIGNNRVRQRLFTQLVANDEHFANAIHPRAMVATSARLGQGVVICAGAVCGPESVVGDNAIINTSATIDHHNRIGDHAHIAPGVHLGGDVMIGEGGFIGIGATVMPQRRVGRWSTVGAGGLVVRDLPDRVVAVGLPARIIREEHGA